MAPWRSQGDLRFDAAPGSCAVYAPRWIEWWGLSSAVGTFLVCAAFLRQKLEGFRRTRKRLEAKATPAGEKRLKHAQKDLAFAVSLFLTLVDGVVLFGYRLSGSYEDRLIGKDIYSTTLAALFHFLFYASVFQFILRFMRAIRSTLKSLIIKREREVMKNMKNQRDSLYKTRQVLLQTEKYHKASTILLKIMVFASLSEISCFFGFHFLTSERAWIRKTLFLSCILASSCIALVLFLEMGQMVRQVNISLKMESDVLKSQNADLLRARRKLVLGRIALVCTAFWSALFFSLGLFQVSLFQVSFEPMILRLQYVTVGVCAAPLFGIFVFWKPNTSTEADNSMKVHASSATTTSSWKS